MRAERGQAAARGALLVGALVAGAAVWWSSSAAPPPLPREPHAVRAANDAAAALAVDDAGGPSHAASDAAAPPREQIERTEIAAMPGGGAALRTAVVGRALDPAGGPLVGFTVLLQCTDRAGRQSQRPEPGVKPWLANRMEALSRPGDAADQPTAAAPQGSGFLATLVCRTDDTGAFVFEPLAAGKYRCNLVGLESVSEKFELALGEVHEVTLQSPLVALTGMLFRNGTLAKDCFVAFDDGKTRRAAPLPDEHGVIRSFAAPGRLQVLVHVARGVHQGPGWGPCLSKQVLLVPDGTPAMHWRLETGGTEVVFAVSDRDGGAIDKFTVDVEGIGACDNERGHFIVAAAPGRGATLAALPPGRWCVGATGEDLRTESRELTTGAGNRREVVTFTAMRAAPLRVILRPSTRFFVDPDADAMPVLQVGGARVTCTSAGLRAAKLSSPAFDYRAVPLGRLTLCFADRIDGDELVPLAFDPIAPVAVDVASGRANEITIDVVPRPFADLRACDAAGKEMAGASLTVWSGGRRIRNRDGATSQRWIGSLPRGDYRVVIERNGVRTEHALRADRAQLREEYRP